MLFALASIFRILFYHLSPGLDSKNMLVEMQRGVKKIEENLCHFLKNMVPSGSLLSYSYILI